MNVPKAAKSISLLADLLVIYFLLEITSHGKQIWWIFEYLLRYIDVSRMTGQWSEPKLDKDKITLSILTFGFDVFICKVQVGDFTPNSTFALVLP